jgi:dTDP-glucose 4,6-dehydratase
MAKRILVTGSAGFVGANFVNYLLDKYKDIEVIGLDSLRHMGDSQRITKNPRFFHFTHDSMFLSQMY